MCKQVVCTRTFHRQIAPLDAKLHTHATRALSSAEDASGPALVRMRAQLAATRRKIRRPAHECRYRLLPIVPRTVVPYPNFSSDAACLRGDQGVMRVVWAERTPRLPLRELVRREAWRPPKLRQINVR